MADRAHFIVDARTYFDLDRDVADPSKPEVRTVADAYHRLLTQGGAVRHLAQHGIDARAVQPPAGMVAIAAGGVPVRLTWGMWEIQCPDCGAVTVALKGAPFLCADCANAARGHEYRPAIWPPELADIEAVLLERPVFRNRNWRPGETIAELITDNIAHGCAVPKHLAHLASAPAPAEMPPPDPAIATGTEP